MSTSSAKAFRTTVTRTAFLPGVEGRRGEDGTYSNGRKRSFRNETDRWQMIRFYAGLYAGANMPKFKKYCELINKDAPWYFEGIQPKREKLTIRGRSKIGNDVWLGRNVIVTNYVNIGKGVIADAGTIITKDVPDYAVVVGTPARIIRYRYSPEEIEALNKIAWWDWQYKSHTKSSISSMPDHGCSTMGCDYLSYGQQPQAVVLLCCIFVTDHIMGHN